MKDEKLLEICKNSKHEYKALKYVFDKTGSYEITIGLSKIASAGYCSIYDLADVWSS